MLPKKSTLIYTIESLHPTTLHRSLPELPRLPRPLYGRTESLTNRALTFRHTHPWVQLSYAIAGVLEVQTAGARFVAPPQRAVWVPAGVEHQVFSSPRTEMRSLYIDGGAVPWGPDACRVLAVSPLLRERFSATIAAVEALFALPFIRSPKVATKAELEESMGVVLKRAFKDPSYTLIFLGFFSCGYQLAFLTAHFPAFITDFCGAIDGGGMLAGLGITTTSALGAVSISVIGLFNIVGTLTAGWLGKRYSKKYLLAGIYTGRTIAAAVFILLPITPASVLIFSAVMGALWLATVPLTSGLVAHIYGIRYMGTLYGFVFLSHQIGGFLGVWLGGKMFDITGDYTLVWWIGVGVGAFSALVHLPIREKPWAAKPA